MDSPRPLQNFRFASFVFVIDPIDTLRLPEYKGSTFRGGFGYAFKKVVSALRNKECPECLLREKCIYSYVFETPPADSRMMRKSPSGPYRSSSFRRWRTTGFTSRGKGCQEMGS